jgi:hypothetical protein
MSAVSHVPAPGQARSHVPEVQAALEALVIEIIDRVDRVMYQMRA